MPSSPKVLKETILETALKLLIRDGYAAINIKSVAKELGCSTQPISRQFSCMDGLRKALFDYSIQYVKALYHSESKDANTVIEAIASGSVALAVEKPNLYRYLYMENQHGFNMSDVTDALKVDNVEEIIETLMQTQGLTLEQTQMYLLNMEIYIHGICDYSATGFAPFPREGVMELIRGASEAFLVQMKTKQE